MPVGPYSCSPTPSPSSTAQERQIRMQMWHHATPSQLQMIRQVRDWMMKTPLLPHPSWCMTPRPAQPQPFTQLPLHLHSHLTLPSTSWVHTLLWAPRSSSPSTLTHYQPFQVSTCCHIQPTPLPSKSLYMNHLGGCAQASKLHFWRDYT